MKHAFLTLFLVAVVALPAWGNGKPPKLHRVVAKGTNGVPAQHGEPGRRAPWIEVAADQKTFDELWKREVPGKHGSKIDFASETVVFLLLGPQATSGYAIEPRDAEIAADGTIRVHAKLEQPMGDKPVLEVITAPYAVIALRTRGAAKFEWVDDDGRLLATKIVE